LVLICFAIKRHYGRVVAAIKRLDVELVDPLEDKNFVPAPSMATLDHVPKDAGLEIDPKKPVAILFVGGYGGLGRHALMTLLRMFPGHFKGVVFCSIAIIDSGNFKGVAEVEELEARVKAELSKYVRFANKLGLPADSVMSTGIEVAVEAEKIGTAEVVKYPKGMFVAGQLLFDEDSTWGRLLHNETAFLIQRRLQRAGVPMIVLPVRLRLTEGPRLAAPSMAG
jgi:hypothetical protein